MLVFYGSFIEPQLITVNRQTIHLGHSGTYVRLAVLGDLHLGPYKGERYVRRIVKKLQNENISLALFLGDYIYKSPKNIDDLKPFANLFAPQGKYGILGNHEYDLPNNSTAGYTINQKTLAQAITGLKQAQITLLNNDHLHFWIGNKRFYLVGVEDLWSGRTNFGGDALHGLSPKIPKILLAHNPDVALLAPHLADLIIAAHTHGGQIVVPGIGPLSRVPTELGRNFTHGLYTINNNQIFITSGLGESGPRARLFMPPEIAILNIEL